MNFRIRGKSLQKDAVFPFEELDKHQIPSSQVTRMVQEGLIDIKYIVKGKNRVKRDTYIELAVDEQVLLEAIEDLGNQAKKQRLVLEFFRKILGLFYSMT